MGGKAEGESLYGKTPADVQAMEQTSLNMSLQSVKDDTKFMRNEGVDAWKNIGQYLAACKKSDDFLTKLVGEKEAQRIIGYGAAERERNIASIKRLSAAEGRVAMTQMTNNNIKGVVNTAVEADSLQTSADIVEHSSANVAQHEMFGSVVNEADRIAEESKRQIDFGNTGAQTDEDKSAARAGVDAANVAAKADAGRMNNEAATAMQARRQKQTLAQTGNIRKLNQRVFEMAFKTNIQCGMDKLTAYTKACDATGSAMVEYFGQRIAKGQCNEVISLLDALERESDEWFKNSRFDKDGKPIIDKETGRQIEGQYNPFAMLCCSHAQFKKLRDSAQSAIYETMRRAKMEDAYRQEAFKIQDAEIRMAADRLSEKSLLDMGKMDELIKKTEKLLSDGYSDADKTSAYLSGIIKSAERKYDKAQKDSEKLQTEEDFQREWDEYNDYLKSSAPFAFYSKNGQIPVAGGKVAAVKDVDGQNRLILLIRNGQARKILKGDVWTARLKKLQEDRASEDYDAALLALSDCGIDLDADKTRAIIEAHGERSAGVADELGDSAPTSLWGKDDSGRLRLRNPDFVMYNWTDPKTGKVTPMTGADMAKLLDVVSRWQKRHVNPSPNGDKTELKNFINGVLRASVRRQTVSHWFKADEVGVPFGFSDISVAGTKAIRDYFEPPAVDKNGKKAYNIRQTSDRDLQVLENLAVNGELPSISEVRKALEERLKRK